MNDVLKLGTKLREIPINQPVKYVVAVDGALGIEILGYTKWSDIIAAHTEEDEQIDWKSGVHTIQEIMPNGLREVNMDDAIEEEREDARHEREHNDDLKSHFGRL